MCSELSLAGSGSGHISDERQRRQRQQRRLGIDIGTAEEYPEVAAMQAEFPDMWAEFAREERERAELLEQSRLNVTKGGTNETGRGLRAVRICSYSAPSPL